MIPPLESPLLHRSQEESIKMWPASEPEHLGGTRVGCDPQPEQQQQHMQQHLQALRVSSRDLWPSSCINKLFVTATI